MAGLAALCPGPANAAERPIPQLSLTLWSAVGYQAPVDSTVNPDNTVLMIPRWLCAVEARSDLRFTLGQAALVARPKFSYGADYATSADESSARTDSSTKVIWTEAFATYPISDVIAVTYGLQNYQWGPAEAAGPSNRIFRDTIQAKDVLYDVRGHHLLRLNLTPDRDWTEVLLIEPSGYGESEFEAGTSFARKALLKSECAWGGGADYAGLVIGWRERAGWWLGEYLSIALTDGLSAYLDASHQQGSLAWYPDEAFSQSKESESRIYTFSVAGLRYSFERGTDLRVEWIFQEAGYSSAEISDAWSILRSSPDSLVYAQRPGLEFPGRQYAFASLRVPDIFKVKDWVFYARCLVSLQDASVSAYASSEAAVGGAGTVFAGFLVSGGSEHSELRGVTGTAITIGYRHAW